MTRSMLRLLVAAVSSAVVAVAVVAWPASGYRKHLCGVEGTVLKPQEFCPGISPPHRWKSVVAYRIQDKGADMCVLVYSKRNRKLFSRCSESASSIYVRPRDLDNGKHQTRVYNKNNNVALPDERRWLYATTTRN